MMMMMGHKQIVAALTRGGRGGTPASVERRIRHWASVGILETAGTAFPGQGRGREYGPEAVYLAAVLNELSKYGIPLGGLRAVADSVNHVLAAGDPMGSLWQAAKTGAPVVLSFAMRHRDDDGFGVAAFSIDDAGAESNPFFPPSEGSSALLIDLRGLFNGLTG